MTNVKIETRKLFKWSEATAESEAVQMQWSVEPVPFTVGWYDVRLFIALSDGEQYDIRVTVERFPYRKSIGQLLGHAGLNYDCFSDEFHDTARALEYARQRFAQDIGECPF